MQEKIEKRLSNFEKQRVAFEKAVKDGTKTSDEFNAWLAMKAHGGGHIKKMSAVLAEESYHTREIAAGIIKDAMPEIYATNMNVSTYILESQIGLNTNFTLYNKDTVNRLIRENPRLLPNVTPKRGKVIRWNERKFNTAITQGILQGESIDNISRRLRSVMGMESRSAVMSARTAVTAAQSKGRMQSFERASKLGIKIKKVWMATVDDRTRHSHAILDGQERDLDEPFDSIYGKIMEPGDPNADDPSDIYNCRCCIVGKTENINYDASDLDSRFSALPDGLSYEDWKEMHMAEVE